MHHSLIDHNAVVHDGYTIEGSEELQAFFSSLGKGYVLSGHTHIQDIAEAQTPSGTIYGISTGALSVYPHNYGQLLIADSKSSGVEYSSHSVDVAAWARASAKETGSSLEARQIVLTTMNVRFFAGRESLNSSDIIGSPAGDLLALLPDGFLSSYARGILSDIGPDDNEIRLQ